MNLKNIAITSLHLTFPLLLHFHELEYITYKIIILKLDRKLYILYDYININSHRVKKEILYA